MPTFLAVLPLSFSVPVTLAHTSRIPIRPLLRTLKPQPQVRPGQINLIIRDFDFADVRNHPPDQYAAIVVFQVPDSAAAGLICELAEKFFAQSEIVTALHWRLAIVEFGRVRLRPPIEH